MLEKRTEANKIKQKQANESRYTETNNMRKSRPVLRVEGRGDDYSLYIRRRREALRLSHVIELAVDDVFQVESGEDVEADAVRRGKQGIQERRDGIAEQD